MGNEPSAAPNRIEGRGTKLKILTIVGAQPQFVKATALSRAVVSTRRGAEVLLHTGQHHDPNMSDVFFKDLDLPSPKFRLSTGSGSHGDMTGR
jgi:UDP-GlcNAc3NAcA epimerase